MVKTPIQTMSSACQNSVKQSSRRTTIGRKPEGRDLRHHRHEPQQPER